MLGVAKIKVSTFFICDTLVPLGVSVIPFVSLLEKRFKRNKRIFFVYLLPLEWPLTLEIRNRVGLSK